MIPKYITIHNTANDASAANEVAYMIRNTNEVSFHVAVDDLEAVQGVPFNRNAWHCSDGKGEGNMKSIGIEICYSKSGGKKFDKAYANAIEITAQLMKKFNIPAANIRYHKNWSGKDCPHRLLSMGITVEKFRQLAQKKYNEMYCKTTVYQVVCGSFEDKKNAEIRVNSLKQKGYSSFIQIK